MFDFDISDIEIGGFTPHTSIQKDKILESANSFEKEMPFDESVVFTSPLDVLRAVNKKTVLIEFSMTNEDYHSEKMHVSSSRVKSALVTEWHYVNYSSKSTSSMELGTLALPHWELLPLQHQVPTLPPLKAH